DVALALPSGLAARLAPKLARALTLPHQILLSEKVGALVVHLAEGDQSELAIAVAAELFQVLPDHRARPAGPAGDEGVPLPAARARFDPWRYGRILEKAVPALAAASVFDALTLFSRLLADAVRLSTRRGDEAKPDDYSSVWRRTIE